MTITQLTNRENFRDIEVCLRDQAGKPYFIACSTIYTITIVDLSFCKDKFNHSSSELRRWAQMESIRALSELHFRIDFLFVGKILTLLKILGEHRSDNS